MRVLLTGANGFVGRELSGALASASFRVRAALRPGRPIPAGTAEVALIDELSAHTAWGEALAGVDTVIHAAARAHRLDDPETKAYSAVNAEATRALAGEAVRAGVRRFIYLSSVKVNGEGRAERYRPDDEPQPADAYAQSKWLGERYLRDCAARSALEVVIVRPPLVYGPQVRGNFLRLLHWVESERPLPLGSIHNARSLVSVWNLCDLLRVLVAHPHAANRTFMVADGEDLSTAELVRRLAAAMGRRARLPAVPAAILRLAAAVSGRGAEFARLCGSLTVDAAATRAALGWAPPLSVTEGIGRTVSWFLAQEEARGS